jgi:hypothetical protein
MYCADAASDAGAAAGAAAGAGAGAVSGAAAGTAAGDEGLSTIPRPVKSKRTAGAKPVAVSLALLDYTFSEIAKISNSTMITRLYHRQLIQIVLAHSMGHWRSTVTASSAELHQKILNDLKFSSQ